MATAKQKAASRRNLMWARAARRGYRGGRGAFARAQLWLDSPAKVRTTHPKARA